METEDIGIMETARQLLLKPELIILVGKKFIKTAVADSPWKVK